VTITAPPTVGLVLTSASGLGGFALPLTISVNGALPQNFPGGNANGALFPSIAIDPPLVIRPGDTITIAGAVPSTPGLCTIPPQATIRGYFFYPGEV
jgi:hypothetical protein